MNELNVKQFKTGIIYSRWLQRTLFGFSFCLGTLMIVASVILILVILKRNQTLVEIDSAAVNLINLSSDMIEDDEKL